MEERIFAYENLAYYSGMKPAEFWDCDYREVVRYCNMTSLRYMENFKEQILIEEAVTDKLIRADALVNEKPKFLSLIKRFKHIFED